jgi:hypothetical protein
MVEDQPERSLAARAAAELALVRVVHQYGSRPEFVLLGGLVPALLCAGSAVPHAGTTDVDVQVDLEIANGAVNAARLERVLRGAGFLPDTRSIWRWQCSGGPQAVIKFELLADMGSQPAQAVIKFDGCRDLGAVNLRGTGLAVRDTEIRTIAAVDEDVERRVELRVTGLAGFLLAKAAAARGRRKAKDWYDIAFVLLHNDRSDARQAAASARAVFGDELPALRSTLTDLRANFTGADAQGTRAYLDQIMLDDPAGDLMTAAADCQLAVQVFCDAVLDD